MPDSELNLMDKNDAPYQNGWKILYSFWECRRCKGIYLVGEDTIPDFCPICVHSSIFKFTDKEPDPLLISSPELIIPFSITETDIAKHLESFASSIPYAPEDLNSQAMINRVQHTYVPVWLVDSAIEAEWSSEVGYYYNTLSHQDQYTENSGGWKSKEVTETRIKWEPRIGRIHRSYSNIQAPALQETNPILQQQIRSFYKNKAIPYQPNAIKKTIIRLPDRPQADAWTDTLPSFQAAATEECRLACEADLIRQFFWKPKFQNQNWTLLLLPVCTTFYMDDEEQFQQVIINGQTGLFTGQKRGSMKRAKKSSLIILSVAAFLFIMGLGLAILSVVVPPIVALSGFLFLAAIIVGIGAIIPIWTVWQFNRS